MKMCPCLLKAIGMAAILLRAGYKDRRNIVISWSGKCLLVISHPIWLIHKCDAKTYVCLNSSTVVQSRDIRWFPSHVPMASLLPHTPLLLSLAACIFHPASHPDGSSSTAGGRAQPLCAELLEWILAWRMWLNFQGQDLLKKNKERFWSRSREVPITSEILLLNTSMKIEITVDLLLYIHIPSQRIMTPIHRCWIVC